MPSREPLVVGAFARLRMAVAVAHSVAGLTLELRFADGTSVRAGPHGGTAGELGICELRAMVIGGGCPPWPVLADRIEHLRLGGAGVVDHGGGLAGRVVPGPDGTRREVWFPTLLAPTTVRDLLHACPTGPDDCIDASLRVDGALGVVTVVCSADERVGAPQLVESARRASAACFVRELLHAASDPAAS